MCLCFCVWFFVFSGRKVAQYCTVTWEMISHYTKRHEGRSTETTCVFSAEARKQACSRLKRIQNIAARSASQPIDVVYDVMKVLDHCGVSLELPSSNEHKSNKTYQAQHARQALPKCSPPSPFSVRRPRGRDRSLRSPPTPAHPVLACAIAKRLAGTPLDFASG